MAQERVTTARIDATSGLKTIRELQTEVKNYRNELVNLERGTKEYNDTLNNLASSQGQINQINADIAASTSNLTSTYSTITGVLSSVAGGFTAVQGVIALTGQSGEALEQTFVKLQAALALTQGITAFSNGIKAARIAMVAFNATVASNPLGALAIGLATATAAIIAFTSTKKDINDLASSYDTLTESISRSNVQLEREIKFLRAAGADQETIIQKRIANQEEVVASYQRELDAIDKARKGANKNELERLAKHRLEVYADYVKGNEALQALNDDLNAYRISSNRKAEEDDEKARQDAAKRRQSERDAELADALAKQEANNKRIQALEADLQKQLEDTNTLYLDRKIQQDNQLARQTAITNDNLASAIQFEIDENTRLQESLRSLIHDPEASIEARLEATAKLQTAIVEGFALEDEAEALRLENIRLAAEKEIELSNLAAEKIKMDEEAKRKAKQQTFDATVALLDSTSNLLSENTAASKALGIASATISTYTGAAQVLANPLQLSPFVKWAQFATTIATGLSAVKNIIGVNVPGASSSTSTSTSASTSIPSFPELTTPIQETHNNLDANDIDYINKPQRVYVTESDISSVQTRVKVAESEAMF